MFVLILVEKKVFYQIFFTLKVQEAHKILDDILNRDPKNAYTVYAKGLAYYHEEKYQESIVYFEKARVLDSSSDMIRADIMMAKAQAKLNNIVKSAPKPVMKAKSPVKRTPIATKTKSSVKRTPTATKTMSPIKRTPKATKTKSPIKRTPPQLHNKHSPPSLGRNVRRFGCEMCNHFFGKKYNLDRHNRTLHDRDTPENFPTSSKQAIAQSKKISKSPISSPKVSKEWDKVEDKMAECPTCKKMFKKSSLARHVVIHSGNKEHQCSYCTMAFFQKSDLARHLVSLFFLYF